MTTLTPGERRLLKLAFKESAFDLAMSRGLTASQLDDITERAINSGKIFLRSADDGLDDVAGYSPSQMFDYLAEKKENAHLFKKTGGEEKKADLVHGMTVAEFEKLSPQRRLEIANQQFFATQRTR